MQRGDQARSKDVKILSVAQKLTEPLPVPTQRYILYKKRYVERNYAGAKALEGKIRPCD